ncbi:MAG: DUF2306 domain-containing protein [Caulobacter sp.]|nr:DUF2306 domain-containing protein [Caulobacter sp.]
MTIPSVDSDPFARAALKALGSAGRFWYLTAAAGQILFLAYVAAFYGGAAATGNFQKWNEVLVGGYVAGGHVGNIALAAHLLLAVVIIAGGLLQLIPWLRARALPFHRWNGRLYLGLAMIAALTGIYMVWTRGTAGGLAMRAGISLNGVLILVCAAMAWIRARQGRIDAHRRWAMRSFILISGVWFFRVGLMAWILANQGPAGIGDDFDGPFVRFWAYGCYLVPLIGLEVYRRVQSSAGARTRAATAIGLTLLTLLQALGIFGAVVGMWLPRL